MPPPVLGAIAAALDIVVQESERRRYLLSETQSFRQILTQAGFDILGSETQIIPVLVGDNAPTLSLAARLREHGLMAVALRPPTVPPGRSRVRFSLSAAHSPEDLAVARTAILEVGREMDLIS